MRLSFKGAFKTRFNSYTYLASNKSNEHIVKNIQGIVFYIFGPVCSVNFHSLLSSHLQSGTRAGSIISSTSNFQSKVGFFFLLVPKSVGSKSCRSFYKVYMGLKNKCIVWKKVKYCHWFFTIHIFNELPEDRL